MGFIDKSLVRCAPLITLSCIDEQYRAHPASRVEEESIICDLANLFTSITFHDSDSRSRTPTTLVLSNNSRSSTSSSSQAISQQLTVGTTSALIRSLFSSILLAPSNSKPQISSCKQGKFNINSNYFAYQKNSVWGAWKSKP